MKKFYNKDIMYPNSSQISTKNILDDDIPYDINGHQKIDNTNKQLDELIRIREIQKKQLENRSDSSVYAIQELNPVFANGLSNSDNLECRSNYQHIRKYTWDGYWPFIGTSIDNPRLEISNVYNTFNGVLTQKWANIIETPTINNFVHKNLLNLCVVTGVDKFDFNLHIENQVNSGPPTFFDINPNSTVTPLNLNQYVIIKDPDFSLYGTNVMGIVDYYNSNKSLYNQFIQDVDDTKLCKNLFLSTQLFTIHINQICTNVKLKIYHNTNDGENIFNIKIKSNAHIDVKETIIAVNIIPVSSDDIIDDIFIMRRTIYIGDQYFMTYSTYINDITSAQQIATISDYFTDVRQIPIQLATMILFGANVPLIDLDTIVPSTDHERMLVRLYKDILKKIS